MSFWTFCLYLIGAVIALIAGWLLIQLLIYIIAITTMKASDGVRSIRRRRADAKWERIEDELDEEESTST